MGKIDRRMVFYFTCSDPRYIIYMGRDKMENEHLIAHGWPEDLWFHVDKHSSAHVYLRLPKGDNFDSVPEDIVHECSQLTKANSIAGSKLANVRIVYTPWSNLQKRADMANGQVGYHDSKKRKFHMIEHKNNAIINKLNKTKTEANNTPRELLELRNDRDFEELKELKRQNAEAFKEKGAVEAERLSRLEDEMARRAAWDEGTLTAYGQTAGHTIVKPKAAKKKGSKKKRFIDKLPEDEIYNDLFGGDCEQNTTSTEGGGLWSDSDDDDFWGDSDDDEIDECASFGAAGMTAWAEKQIHSQGYGALGKQAAILELTSKSDNMMDKLAAVAHARKAEQEKKTAEIRAKKEAKAAAEANAAAKKAAAKGEALLARHKAESSAVDGGNAAAVADLEALKSSGGLDEVLEANQEAQEEELMVLESIFDELFTQDEDDTGCFTLAVVGENTNGKEMKLMMKVKFVPEYPSHLPPTLQIVDGIPEADQALVIDALTAKYFKAREEARESEEPVEAQVYIWTEWLKEEWMLSHN